MGKLKNEYNSFLEDMEKNIKDQEDLKYIKTRFVSFMDTIMEQIDSIMDYKKQEIDNLEEKQKKIESKLEKMQQIIDNIEKDIYAEEGFDFEITCPYCNYEFIIDMDEEKTEILCPECQNTIELDWTGDIDDETHNNCSGSCGECDGCGDNDDEDDDM